MKILVDKFLLLVLLFVVVSCGGSTMVDNKYMLDEFRFSQDTTGAFKDKTIMISAVNQSPIMRISNIPYKLSSVKVNYFIGDKWVARVDDLLKRRLFEALQGSEMFLDVFDGPSLVSPDYYLTVYIDYLGEELIDERRYATAKLDVRIIGKDNATLFFDKIDSKVLIDENIKDDDYVSKLVQTLSSNVSKSLEKSFFKFYNIQD